MYKLRVNAHLRVYDQSQRAENLLIVQPYHPFLFRQGVLPGPLLLMECSRRNLPEEKLEEAWRAAETETTESKGNDFLRCGDCSDVAI